MSLLCRLAEGFSLKSWNQALGSFGPPSWLLSSADRSCWCMDTEEGSSSKFGGEFGWHIFIEEAVVLSEVGASADVETGTSAS